MATRLLGRLGEVLCLSFGRALDDVILIGFDADLAAFVDVVLLHQDAPGGARELRPQNAGIGVLRQVNGVAAAQLITGDVDAILDEVRPERQSQCSRDGTY